MKNLETVLDYCLGKLGAEETFPFGNDVSVIKVASKMFALLSINNNLSQISLKTDPMKADFLRQKYPAVTPGYHLNKMHWNTVTIDGSVPDSVIRRMIDESYDLVFAGLKKSEKLQIEMLET